MILNIREDVKRNLEQFPETRDNDRLLLITIWKDDIFGIKTCGGDWEGTFRDFEKWYLEGKLTSAENIKRARQHIQQHHPELRGKRYAERKHLKELAKQEILDL